MISETKIQLSEHQVRQLIERALPDSKPIDIRELADGWCNRAYWVNLAAHVPIVLKIGPHSNTKMLRYEKNMMSNEVEILRRFSHDKRIPVPEVFHFNQDRSLVDAEYFVMEALQGDGLHRVENHMNKLSKLAINRQMAKILKAINSYTSESFGYFCSQHMAWYAALKEMFEWLYLDADDFSVSLPIDIQSFFAQFKAAEAAFTEIDTGRLVHWDLQPGNVIVNKHNGLWRIDGVFDFERVLWGDPLMEYNFGPVGKRRFFTLFYANYLWQSRNEMIRREFYNIYLMFVLLIENRCRQYQQPDLVKNVTAYLDVEWKKLNDLLNSRP